MTAKRALIALAVGLAVIFAIVSGRDANRQQPAVAEEDKPRLLLLTTLPIIFAEQLTLDAPASPVLEALQQRYRVEPISVTAADALGQARLLLMIQPQAQPAEQLVELDQWVRGGGRLLLLADPALAWPSERGLGDPLRPPPAFADTGLLDHWGLRLDPPRAFGAVEIAGKQIHTTAPGTLTRTRPGCTLSGQGLIARCGVGRGRVTVIADADFLNVDGSESADSAASLGLLIAELDRLGQ